MLGLQKVEHSLIIKFDTDTLQARLDFPGSWLSQSR